MQPKHPSFLLLAVFGASVLIQGCHKSNKAAPAPRIASVTATTGGSTTNYQLTYNSSGQLTLVQVTGASNYTETLSYSPNRIITATTFNNSSTVATVDTVNLDAAGNPSSIIIASYGGGISRLDFTRDAREQLTQMTNAYNGNAPTTTTFTYTNGDITAGSSNGSAFSYTYYTDKPAALGDCQSIFQWIQYGVVVYKSAHLCKSFTGATITENFTYTFDSKGNITDAVSATPGLPISSYHYVYQNN